MIENSVTFEKFLKNCTFVDLTAGDIEVVSNYYGNIFAKHDKNI